MTDAFSFIKTKQEYLLLFLIVTFAFLFRISNLSDNPPGFFADEASIGYNAYTLLTSGRDEYGNLFPIFFQAFGEYKSPIQIYSTIPSIALFSLSEFAVRIPSVIYGTITVLMLFFLTKELTKGLEHSSAIALFSSLFLAISPWHIHISRIAFEQTPYVFFSILGLFFLIKARSHIHYLPYSCLFFALGLYSYFPARIFIPLFSLSIFFLFFKSFHRHKKQIITCTLLSLFLLIPLLGTFITGAGFSRWNQVSIFTDAKTLSDAFMHIITNYLSHFSLDFLFLKGDIGMPGQFITRHSVRGIGELYLFQLPFILFGLWYLLQKKQYSSLTVLILWLLLYPTGSMFTTDISAQATRSVIGVIPFQILTALGIVGLATRLNRHHRVASLTLIGTVLCVTLLSTAHYLTLLFTKYPTYAYDFWGWQYGASGIVHRFIKYENEYDQFIMQPAFNAPYIFFSFYAHDKCKRCTVGSPKTHYIKGQKQLFAITPEYLQQNSVHFKTKDVVFYPNNTVAFLIGEIVE